MAKFLAILGILGILYGLYLVIATAVGSINHEDPSRGYIGGVIFIVFGGLRFVRNMNR